MLSSPEYYLRRAIEVEALAATTSDPVIKRGYLDLAAAYRNFCTLATRDTDADLQLAKRMVGNTTSEL